MVDKRQILDSARRVYGEVVRGRTRVRVVAEASTAADTTPRFLLSPYRSGTTLFRYCMDSHPDLAAPPETDFIAPLMAVLGDEASMVGLADLGYSTEDVRAKLGDFARRFLDTYAASKGANEGWMDKSPRYAENPWPLRALFPGARFVVMHRHPLDQIHSFTRGGTFVHPALGSVHTGIEAIVRAAEYWEGVTRGLIAFAQTSDDTVQTTYEGLCSDPRETLRSVVSHFKLGWNDDVLNYHQKDHDLGREAGRVAGTVGFSPISGGWRSWEPRWQDAAWERVAGAAGLVGYRGPL